jgi:hypothetical protein
MQPDVSLATRDVLDRLRAQVHAHLPPVTDRGNQPVAESVVPLDRLPMLGQVVEQLVNAEAVFASVNQAVGGEVGAESTE